MLCFHSLDSDIECQHSGMADEQSMKCICQLQRGMYITPATLIHLRKSALCPHLGRCPCLMWPYSRPTPLMRNHVAFEQPDTPQ